MSPAIRAVCLPDRPWRLVQPPDFSIKHPEPNRHPCRLESRVNPCTPITSPFLIDTHRRVQNASSLKYRLLAATLAACENQLLRAPRRYRLKVRTEPSQGSNPGSSPGIATNRLALGAEPRWRGTLFAFLLSLGHNVPCSARRSNCQFHSTATPHRQVSSHRPASRERNARDHTHSER
jgi:hypothetical protein